MSKTPGKILGYDGAGIVEAAGPSALFKPGDEVFYAGSAARAGSNSQLQLVDSRIVARKPRNLDWDEAAAIPLVGITAWEMLEEKFHLVPNADNKDVSLIVVNAAGGVGTLALILALKVSRAGTSGNDIANRVVILVGIQHRPHHCNRVTSRDHRVGQEVWRDGCHISPSASWTPTRGARCPTIACLSVSRHPDLRRAARSTYASVWSHRVDRRVGRLGTDQR